MLKEVIQEILQETMQENTVIQKIKIAISKLSKDEFLDLVKRGRIGGCLSVPDIIKYIENNSKDKLDYNELQKALTKNTIGKYFPCEIDAKILKIKDKEIVDKENQNRDYKKSNDPIVIDNDYYIIDGRHRAASTKGKIKAYIPAELFYDLVKSKEC